MTAVPPCVAQTAGALVFVALALLNFALTKHTATHPYGWAAPWALVRSAPALWCLQPI